MGKRKKKALKHRMSILKEILEWMALITGIASAIYTMLKGRANRQEGESSPAQPKYTTSEILWSRNSKAPQFSSYSSQTFCWLSSTDSMPLIS